MIQSTPSLWVNSIIFLPDHPVSRCACRGLEMDNEMSSTRLATQIVLKYAPLGIKITRWKYHEDSFVYFAEDA